MNQNETSIVLVVPCYNERNRLNVSQIQEYVSPHIRFCFVDDGSKDGTAEYLQSQFNSPFVTVLKLGRNSGKAEAVRQGMLHVFENKIGEGADWIGFWDADLATPLAEVANMLKYRELFCPNANVMFASRVAKLGSDIKRSYLRHYLGRLFATALDLVLKVQPYDSQCGAKLFQTTLVTRTFAEPFISRWIFDVEILLRLRNEAVVEYPLLSWRDVPGSKVRIGREAFRVLADLWRIRKKYSNQAQAVAPSRIAAQTDVSERKTRIGA